MMKTCAGAKPNSIIINGFSQQDVTVDVHIVHFKIWVHISCNKKEEVLGIHQLVVKSCWIHYSVCFIIMLHNLQRISNFEVKCEFKAGGAGTVYLGHSKVNPECISQK